MALRWLLDGLAERHTMVISKDKVDYYGDNVITNGLGKDNPNYTLAAFKFK